MSPPSPFCLFYLSFYCCLRCYLLVICVICKYTMLITYFQFSTSSSMFLSSLRCVPAPIIHIFLPFIPHWLRRSSACVLCWPTLRGVVPGLGALCSWCCSVPTGGASGCWVPGETGRSARQTSRSVIVQVPAWLTKGRAVSTHLLECSPDARSVWPQLRWGYGRQAFRTCLQSKLRLFIHFRTIDPLSTYLASPCICLRNKMLLPWIPILHLSTIWRNIFFICNWNYKITFTVIKFNIAWPISSLQ